MKPKNTPGQSQAKKKIQPKPVKAATVEPWKLYAALSGILLISFLVYLPVFGNGFVWDDEVYLLRNPLIYTLDIKSIFSQYVLGNYHPLTILAFAIEYHLFGLNATGYHTVNLFLHLFNVILVFYAVFMLSKNNGVALIAALLFGIHPMHVESVAWVSELKDLLYAMFFLGSYIFYLKFSESKQKKFYVLALLMFLLSLLSKAMAASLPVLLILTDYFKGRKINAKTLTEKIPFIMIAIILGIVAIYAQRSVSAVNIVTFPFLQRIIFASYGFITYLIRFILPLGLSPFYPYPIALGQSIPIWYYVYVLILIGLGVYVFYSMRVTRKIFFGIGFFAVTVFLVLQLLPVGNAIMADRYGYIPSIGIFYLAAEGFMLLWNKKLKPVAIILLCAFSVFFSIKTYSLSSVWKNGMSLWSGVISHYQTVPLAYNNRGVIFMDQKKNEQAIADFSMAIQLNPNFLQAYQNRSIIYISMKKYPEAFADNSKIIELNPSDTNAYNVRGAIYMIDKKYPEAIKEYNKAIELSPSFYRAYFNRGTVFYNEKKYPEAINDLSRAITLKPDFADAYYARGWSEYYSGNIDAACQDVKQSANLGYQVPAEALKMICH